MHAAVKKCLSVFLVLCMVLTLHSPVVLADQNTDAAVSAAEETAGTEEQENSLQEEIDISGTGEAVTSGSESSDSDEEPGENRSEISSDDTDNLIEESGSDTDSSSADESSVSADSEETEENAEDSEEEESEFEETGILDLAITDNNGVEVDAWYDETENVYYLFLTNAISIPDLELEIGGIKMKKSSAGELDTKTNTLTGAFSASGDGVTLTAENGVKYNVVVRQSGIPSLSITLNGTTLSTINSGSKDTKYAGQTVVLTDASGSVNVSQTDVELKGRGNSTWSFSNKKPYQLKFSKKQSVLGMAKAKKWILLANSYDDTMMRNMLALNLGDSIGMKFTPDAEYVELWVDGEYRGLYVICEKCEIDSNRLDLTDSLGALMEYDNGFYEEEDYWYYDKALGTHFALKESVDEDNAQAAMENFQSKTAAFAKYLSNTSPANVTIAGLSKYIDVESFAKWYLVNEYLNNAESFVSSWYWYCDGASDVLHLGPLWDFDSSQGNNAVTDTTTGLYGRSRQTMFIKLFKSPAFAAYVRQIYQQYRGNFSALSSEAAALGSQLSGVADSNYIRWKFLGKANAKGKEKAFASTYSGAVSELTTWLTARDAGFTVSVPNAVTADTSVSVSETGRYMTIKAANVTGTTSVSAAVWSAKSGQDDLKWYTLTKGSDGVYSIKVDLKKHGSSDTYYAHVYSGSTLLGTHSEKVTMKTLKPSVTASYNVQTDKIKITISDIADYTSLQTAIWTKTGGQDDIRWVTKTVSGANTVSFNINASTLKHSGTVYVHVYGTASSKQSFLTSTTAEMGTAGDPSVTAVQTDGGSILKVTVDNAPGWTSMKAAVWGAKNGQNDIKWYTMTRNSDGTWTYYVDLTKHNETGQYHVHVYGTINSKQTLAGKTSLTVDLSVTPEVTVETVEEGVKLKATLKNASSLDSVSVAVWGQPDGQNDLVWYTGKKNSDGTWYVNIPLSSHKETGTYYIHAYGKKNSKQTFQAAVAVTVDELNITYVDTILSASQKTMSVNLENPDSYTSVSFAVWGAPDGQNDIKWYTARQNVDGSWSASVNLSTHKETGKYYVHAYAVKSGKQSFAASSTVTVDAFADIEVTASAAGNTFMAKAAMPRTVRKSASLYGHQRMDRMTSSGIPVPNIQTEASAVLRLLQITAAAEPISSMPMEPLTASRPSLVRRRMC